MAEQFVGRVSEFTDGSRQIVKVGNTEVGVFRHEGGRIVDEKERGRGHRERASVGMRRNER